MTKLKTLSFYLIAGLVLAGLVAANPASAACKNRGDLDIRFCDDDGDLVADTPADSSKWLNPGTIVFSYTPVEDPSVYENVFTEFMDYLAKATGKKVKPGLPRWITKLMTCLGDSAIRINAIHTS